MNVIDLFSGLGGFSQAFVDRGHKVIRYEINERFSEIPYTIIKDVMELTSIDLENADIILASVPCQHFSIASVYHHWPKPLKEPTEATLQQIELVKHTLRIIKEANPKYWILENPRGMLRKAIGKPNKFIYLGAWSKKNKKATDLWGKFPPIDWRLCHKHIKAKRGSKTGVQDPSLSVAERALIPYDFSLAVCLAVEGNSPQTTLEEFVE